MTDDFTLGPPSIDGFANALPDGSTGNRVDGSTDVLADSSFDGSSDALADAASDDANIQVDECAETGPGCACAWGAPQQIVGLGSTGSLWGPALSPDGKTLYFGLQLTTQEQIYYATRPDDGNVFSQPTALSSVNSTSSEGTPFLSYDGLTLYFYSTRAGGLGGRDLWFATTITAPADFASATWMMGVNSGVMDDLPWVSHDELTLLFVSNRPGGPGGSDIYIATRSDPTGNFSAPTVLPAPVQGAAVNTTANEDRAVMSQDGLTLYYATDFGNATSNYDLWMATRPDTTSPFSNPTPMTALNSPGTDTNVMLSPDGGELFFSSTRGGTEQIWRSVWQCTAAQTDP